MASVAIVKRSLKPLGLIVVVGLLIALPLPIFAGLFTIGVALHMSWWMRKENRAWRVGGKPTRTVRELAAEYWVLRQKDFSDLSHIKPREKKPKELKVGKVRQPIGPTLQKMDSGIMSIAGAKASRSAATLTALIALLLVVGTTSRMPLWGAGVTLALVVGIAAAPVLRQRAGYGTARLLEAARSGSTALFTAAGTTLFYVTTMNQPAIIVPVVTAVAVLAAGSGGRPTKQGWWTQRVLVGQLIAAGILPSVKTGDPLPVIRYFGAPKVDEVGIMVTIGLPAGRSFSDAQKGHERLAASFGIPVGRLLLLQDRGDAAGTVRIMVLEPLKAGTTRAAIGAAHTATWIDPVVIGKDILTQPISLEMFEANTLISGRPGSGKTSIARIILLSYLLDPEASSIVIDGKGSKKDYAAGRALYSEFVSGAQEDAVERTLEIFKELFETIRSRNGELDHGDDAPPGILLLLEEYQDIREAATTTRPAVGQLSQRDQLDSLLGRIVRMGRAVSVHVLISTQRPSVEDVPSGVRNLISQRIALAMRNGADISMVLGTKPDLELPKEKGEAILATSSAVTAVHLDYLDNDDWREGCKRAAELRPKQAPVLVSTVETDELEDEVLQILAGSSGMTATEILSRLSPGVAPSTTVALGKRLGTYASLERARVGKSSGWRVSPAHVVERATSPAAPLQLTAAPDVEPEPATSGVGGWRVA